MVLQPAAGRYGNLSSALITRNAASGTLTLQLRGRICGRKQARELTEPEISK